MTIVLNRHKTTPEADRPELYFRNLRRRAHKELGRRLNALRGLTDTADPDEANRALDELEAFLIANVVGWSNQTDEADAPLPFDAADLDRAITTEEFGEVAGKLFFGIGPDAADKKKFGSPSESSSEPPPNDATVSVATNASVGPSSP